jgi:hypothetical protein
MVVPASQKWWLARLAKESGGRMRWIELSQLVSRPAHEEQFYPARQLFISWQRHIVFQRDPVFDAQLFEPMVVLQLVDRHVSAKYLLADSDTSLCSFKGNVFGVKGVDRDQDPI